MINRRLTLLLWALALSVLVLFMSWRDLHPVIKTQTSGAPRIYTYYAGADIPAAMVPRDALPLIVHAAVPPHSFPPRQISLLLPLDHLPEDHAHTFDDIRKHLRAWRKQGHIIAYVILDYRPQTPEDFKAYAAFLRDFNATFKKNPYVRIVAEPSWFSRKDAAPLLEDPPFLLIDLPHAEATPEEIKALSAAPARFQLRFPPGVMAADVDIAHLADIDALTDYVFSLTPDKPWPPHGPQIGVWPKL